MATKNDHGNGRFADLRTGAFWLVTAFAGLAAGAVYWWLSRITDNPQDPAAAQLSVDVVARSLTVFAGVGGALALWLSFRRQQHTERDARDARITELRIQAVEQLGSDKAAVRIGGLHNLERLGQQHPELRQLILNEICAYLRMPYTPPQDVLSLDLLRGRADDAVNYSTAGDSEAASKVRQESEVRSTAQGILERHLSAKSEYWEHTDLNLSGALLQDLNLKGARLHNIAFRSVVFAGDTNFYNTAFHGAADFGSAEFRGEANFESVTFHDEAHLEKARFEGWTNFGLAEFQGAVLFVGATFEFLARFNLAEFQDAAYFVDVRFRDSVVFESARFQHSSMFWSAEFGGAANFRKTEFGADLLEFGSPAVAKIDVEAPGHFWPTEWQFELIEDQPGYEHIVLARAEPE